MLQKDFRRGPSSTSLALEFGSLIAAAVPSVLLQADVYSWAAENYILGTDGPFRHGIVWGDVFVPGTYQQVAATLQRYERILPDTATCVVSKSESTTATTSRRRYSCVQWNDITRTIPVEVEGVQLTATWSREAWPPRISSVARSVHRKRLISISAVSD